MTSLLAAAYASKRGARNTASGQARRARAVGIAEWIPNTTSLVARRSDDAPATEAADDDRPAAKRRVGELLDRRVERVEIEVQDPRCVVADRARAGGHGMVRRTSSESRLLPRTS